MALFAGLLPPQLFGRVASQSAAFGAGKRESVFFELKCHGLRQPFKVRPDGGRYESLLDANLQRVAALVGRGCDAAYREFNAGYNVPAWRDHIGHGLELLFRPAYTMKASLPKGATIAYLS